MRQADVSAPFPPVARSPRALWSMALTLFLLSATGARPAEAQPASDEEASPLTTLLRQETTTLATLESLARWLAEAQQQLELARQESAQLAYQEKEATRRVEALDKRMVQRRARLHRRLRALYKLSRGGVVRLVLEAADAQDLSLRLSTASRVLERDVSEIRLYQRELAQLTTQRQALEAQRRDKQALLERIERQEARYQQAEAKHQALLDRLRGSRRSRQRITRELSTYQRSLLERIERIEQRRARTGGFLKLKGRLKPPVQGWVAAECGKLIDGEERLAILRPGMTFGLSRPRRPRAVAPGRVAVAGPLKGYGQLVLVAHDDGFFSLYGFLAKVLVEEGQSVQAGTPLGRTGQDPLTGREALYFELRAGSRPLDPRSWLNL